MGIFKKSPPPGRSSGLDEAVQSARSLMSSYGRMGYDSRHAVEVGTSFMGYLNEIYGLGGCAEISKMLEDSKRDKPYFHDKLNWFHNKHCSG